MNRIFFLGGVLTLAALNPVVAADDYLGAKVALQKIASAESTVTKPPENSSEAAKLKRDIETFKKQSGSLKPEAAARDWLALLERQWKLPASEMQSPFAHRSSEEAFNPQDIWGALPAPATWDALRKAVDSRPAGKGKTAARELALRLFAHTLVADRAAQNKDIAEMEALFSRLSQEESYQLGGALERIAEILIQNSDDADAVMRLLERRLALDPGDSYQRQLSVPDLIALVGNDKAEAFLRRALTNSNTELEVERGEDTKKLARRLALELTGQLKKPQWKLACSLEATALYEALEKKFTTAEVTETNVTSEAGVPNLDRFLQRDRRGGGGGSQQMAQTYYFLGLIAAGRNADAVALARKLGRGDNIYLPADALKSLERAGHTQALHDFFRELLSQNPDLPFWNEYIQLAAKVGETGQMLELARKIAARDDVSDKQRNLIRQNLYRALLAADQVEEGIGEIRQILANKDLKIGDRYQPESMGRGGLAITLVELGQLLGRPELVEEGLRFARESIASQAARQDMGESLQLKLRLAEVLSELGRGSEAEAALIASITELSRKESSRSAEGRDSAAPALIALAGLYHQAGRHDDVIVLLDQSPDWGAKDVKTLRSGFGGFGYRTKHDSDESKISVATASALLNAGRKAEAHKVVEAMLDENSGYDPAYELLLKMGGDDLLAQLDLIFARDQFEERPLIWKAVLLKQAGKLEEAEAVARRAISIDPSDGEQGPGRRMRAYAVLADIREARGDKKQADFFREAVKAIRLSEEADRYYQAGLLKRAVKMYQDSLTHFADAYCIQSRLAIQLAELGQHQQAEEHYRRAYELMPESFGRVESHCFGCERAFDGERAQGIAEKVFTKLAQSTPDKPQVHYMLGYLREEQGRYAEALASYRKAVSLDPEYLNAWKHIQSVGEQYRLPAKDKDAAALNLIRLDPLGRHGGGSDARNVTDLRALWSVIEAATKLAPPPVESVYPLTASKARMEQKGKEPSEAGRDFDYQLYEMQMTERRLQPALAIMDNSFIAAVMPVLGGYGEMFADDQ